MEVAETRGKGCRSSRAVELEAAIGLRGGQMYGGGEAGGESWRLETGDWREQR